MVCVSISILSFDMSSHILHYSIRNLFIYWGYGFTDISVNLQPFRSRYSKLNTTFIILLTMFYISLAGLDTAAIKDHCYITYYYVVTIIIAISPLLYIPLVIFFWLYSRRRCCCVLAYRIKAMRNGYFQMEISEECFYSIQHTRSAHSNLHACAWRTSQLNEFH